MDDPVRRFIAAINAQDAEALCALMTDDHMLIDSGGQTVRGRASLQQAWHDYFTMMPDYRIDVTDMLRHGSTVAIFGAAGGTYAPDGELREECRWHVPAAWRAVVREQQVAEWQVFADNSPVCQIISRANGK